MRKVIGGKYQNSKIKMSQVFSAYHVWYVFNTGGNKIAFKLFSILPKKENKKEKTLNF